MGYRLLVLMIPNLCDNGSICITCGDHVLDSYANIKSKQMNYRLGFIIDFLSKATLIGFMAGAAIIVSLQQLKGLLGITHFTSKMEIIPVMSSVFSHKNEVTYLMMLMAIYVPLYLLHLTFYAIRCVNLSSVY